MWYLSNFLKTAMPTMARTLNFTLRRLPCWIWPGPLGSYVISLHEEYYVDYGQDPKGYVFYLSEDWDVDYGQDPRTYLLSHFEKIAMLTMARTPQIICYLTLRRLLCWLWPGPHRLSGGGVPSGDPPGTPGTTGQGPGRKPGIHSFGMDLWFVLRLCNFHWIGPTGPIQSMSRDVRLCVCLFVCLCHRM